MILEVDLIEEGVRIGSRHSGHRLVLLLVGPAPHFVVFLRTPDGGLVSLQELVFVGDRTNDLEFFGFFQMTLRTLFFELLERFQFLGLDRVLLLRGPFQILRPLQTLLVFQAFLGRQLLLFVLFHLLDFLLDFLGVVDLYWSFHLLLLDLMARKSDPPFVLVNLCVRGKLYFLQKLGLKKRRRDFMVSLLGGVLDGEVDLLDFFV